MPRTQKRKRDTTSSSNEGTLLSGFKPGRPLLFVLIGFGILQISLTSKKVDLTSLLGDLFTKSQSLNFNMDATNQQGQRQTSSVYTGYKPAPVESYLMQNAQELGLANPIPQTAPTCHIWKDPQVTPFYPQLHDFLKELVAYYDKVKGFQLPLTLQDLRHNITNTNHQVCDLVKLHPDGLPGLFAKSQQLSWTKSGWVEPLMAPMRHPKFCVEGRHKLMDIDYLLHDFYEMCLQLKPTSKTVFIDMGASLSFHHRDDSPVIFVLDLYKKFGFKFDHIYAYEVKQEDPSSVFNRLPEEYEAAYHWINLGVASDPDSRQNPLKMLLQNFNEDDLVIVKLDVDTPEIELPLARQLRDNPRLGKLIDHFYFEHHMNQEELARNWEFGQTPHMNETVFESLELFTKIRQQGIAAHYWV